MSKKLTTNDMLQELTKTKQRAFLTDQKARGIPDAQITKNFEKFQRMDNNRTSRRVAAYNALTGS